VVALNTKTRNFINLGTVATLTMLYDPSIVGWQMGLHPFITLGRVCTVLTVLYAHGKMIISYHTTMADTVMATYPHFRGHCTHSTVVHMQGIMH